MFSLTPVSPHYRTPSPPPLSIGGSNSPKPTPEAQALLQHDSSPSVMAALGSARRVLTRSTRGGGGPDPAASDSAAKL
eukprot:1628571-Rhodomonas_salina.1